MGRKGASRHRFALPNPRRTIPPAIFQTVSLERLSGNSERAPLRGLTSLRNRTKGHHLDASRYRKTRDPTRAASFQTVSIETVWKLLRTGQSPRHEPRHRRVDEGLSGGAQPLVVLGHAPVVGDPREGPLHHPPSGQDSETPGRHELLPIHRLTLLGPLLGPQLCHLLGDRLLGLAYHLHAQAHRLLGPPFAPPLVAGIDP